MGLLLSVVISYAGVNEAIECLRHILSGVVPENDPDFQDLVEYYSRQLQKTANPTISGNDWTKHCGQGYLCLNQDKNGKLKSAAVKYYDGQPDSTAILFSTKISSFGQESTESNSSQANGDYKTERYSQPRTKTIITDTSESFSVGQRNKSPFPEPTSDNWLSRNSTERIDENYNTKSFVEKTPDEQFESLDYTSDLLNRDNEENLKEKLNYENVSDHNRFSGDSSEPNGREAIEQSETKEKLTWHYRPLSPVPQRLPEIQFQSFEDDKGDKVYSEDYLRSLDGIKFRPLQRNDPTGRRRSFKKRHSSSSTSSRESRASREEELKVFTSLEEAEFERMNKDAIVGGFGSTPNLSPRSYSRSRSRENSKEKRSESWSVEAPVEPAADDSELKPRLKDLPKLSSFEEEREENKENKEVTEEAEVDFWGNSGD